MASPWVAAPSWSTRPVRWSLVLPARVVLGAAAAATVAVAAAKAVFAVPMARARAVVAAAGAGAMVVAATAAATATEPGARSQASRKSSCGSFFHARRQAQGCGSAPIRGPELAQQFGHHPHLPGNDAVAHSSPLGGKCPVGKILGTHQEGHGIPVFARQWRVDVTRADGGYAHARSAQFPTQTFAVADECRLARAIRPMAGQPPDAGHAGNTHQPTTAALHHGVDEGLKGGGCAHRVGGEDPGHGVEVFTQRGIDTDTDAGIGDDHVRHTLALQAVQSSRHDALDLRDICTINLVAVSAYSVCFSP